MFVSSCRADVVISEEAIVVPRFDVDDGSSWEVHVEIVRFVELWLSSVELVVFPFGHCVLSTFQNKIWVTFTEKIMRYEVKPFKDVESTLGCDWVSQSVEQALLELEVGDELI